ncbi:MAG: CBS domain-containing protein, partial [Proteobacteria bacterium]|nr:CBS domain-containing protein [Pseudomonadota bacterium]
DLMHTGTALPRVALDAGMEAAVMEMSAKRFGVTGVFDEAGMLVGVITDGDIRRELAGGNRVFEKKAADVMTATPKVIREGSLVEAALRVMDEHSITSLFVLEGEGTKVLGIVHLHDLIKAGVL